eukprot:229098-Pyramimonas_sp.AAC.1
MPCGLRRSLKDDDGGGGEDDDGDMGQSSVFVLRGVVWDLVGTLGPLDLGVSGASGGGGRVKFGGILNSLRPRARSVFAG